MQSTEAIATNTNRARRTTEVLGQAWAWLFLLALIVIFSATGHGFLSLFNFQSIGANMAITLIMALGQTFVIISGGIDLSTGFVMGLASVVAATAMTNLDPSTPLPVIVLVGLAAGLAAGLIPGLINGLLIARLRVPPFIVTLGMLGIARGAGFLLSGGMPVPVQIKNLGQIGNGYLLYYHANYGLTFLSPPPGLSGAELRALSGILPHPLTLVILLIIILHFVLSRTQFGLHTYAVGGNREASLRAGIPVVSHTTKIYLLSSLLAAVAGVLYNVRFTNGAANAGDAVLLDSIAAVVIGGASLFGGEGRIMGTVIGALIIAIIQNGLVILAINPFWQFIAVGTVIILAVLMDQARARVIK
jgi:ribose/xylose/arabinose/galactoside ABC-type transport system permease subunit